tara:strand:+ start:53974 stop:54105 length:132 start_codon:yes stop_codon:yes gene_type:complete
VGAAQLGRLESLRAWQRDAERDLIIHEPAAVAVAIAIAIAIPI